MVRRPWVSAPVGRDGFKTAPAKVKQDGYLAAMAERLSESTGVPFHYYETGLLSPGWGYPGLPLWNAFREAPDGHRMVFKYFAFHVQGFPAWPVPNRHYFLLALYEPAAEAAFTMRWSDPCDRFVYRIVEVREAESPKTLSEVRDRVENDVRFLHASRGVGEVARECCRVAAEKGMDAAAAWIRDRHPELASEPRELRPFTRRTPASLEYARETGFATQAPMVLPLGQEAEFADRCFSLARSATSQPVVDKGVKHRVDILELPATRQWAVIEPVRLDPFAGDMKQAAETIIKASREAEARRKWFTPTEIRRRGKYQTPGVLMERP
jgi:hypothetical protein